MKRSDTLTLPRIVTSLPGVLALLIGMHGAAVGQVGGGEPYSINNPTEGESFSKTATIATNGDRQIDVAVTVKLTKGGVTQDSATIPSGSASWSHDFDAPSGGWATGEDWKCELWADGVKKAEVSFKVVD